ncbi:hypothetical protein H3C66_04040 [Patescibacteria group bacterium]|nr:hypothetical protein [Patescibacteria group bacterium]
MKHDFLTRQNYTHSLPKKVFLGLAIILSIVALAFSTRPGGNLEVFAQTATSATKASPRPTASPRVSPSPSPSASPSGAVATENLKERIDRILDQREAKLEELHQAGQRRRVFLGEVQRITERTVTIRNRRGSQSFTVGADVVLVRNGKAATIDDIAVGDWIGVIGFADKETIQPQIVVIPTTTIQPTSYETVIGTITEVTRTQIVVTDPSQNEQTFQIVRTTEFEGSDGNAIRREDLETETQVIVVSKPTDTQKPATLIRSLAGQR